MFLFVFVALCTCLPLGVSAVSKEANPSNFESRIYKFLNQEIESLKFGVSSDPDYFAFYEKVHDLALNSDDLNDADGKRKISKIVDILDEVKQDKWTDKKKETYANSLVDACTKLKIKLANEFYKGDDTMAETILREFYAAVKEHSLLDAQDHERENVILKIVRSNYFSQDIESDPLEDLIRNDDSE